MLIRNAAVLQPTNCGGNTEVEMRAACKRLRILELPAPRRRHAGGRHKGAGTLRPSAKPALASARVAAAASRP